MEYIENLRGKPEHVRKRFAFIVSFSFSFLLFAGWIFTSYGLKSSPILAEKSSESVAVEKPVSSLTASAIGVFDDIKAMFAGSNKAEYVSELEVEAGGR